MNDLQQLEKLYNTRDIKGLDKLAIAKPRILNKDLNFRSALMLSANNIKHLLKIPSLEADAIILNLEDGVSKKDKPFALVLTAIFLSHYIKINKKLIVRVNALNEGGYDEIAYLNQFKPDAIRVSKIKTAKEVESILHLLHEDIELHLSIETSKSWLNLTSLAKGKRVTVFFLGLLDLFADLGLNQSLITRENPTLLHMLSHFLITCKALHVKPVSFVFQEFKQLDEFQKWLNLEKSMGYEAKGCISPKQAELTNKIFINTKSQLLRAKTIVKLFEMHQDMGITGFVDNEFGFIDEPIYKDALNILKS